MNSPLDYYQNIELNPDAPHPAEPAVASVSGDQLLAEVGDACLTRAAVQEAVHEAVTDAVQAAVTDAVAAAVAAAVSSVSTDPQEAEIRFRQKYLGLGSVDAAKSPQPLMDPESPLVEVPRLITDAVGAVVVQAAAETDEGKARADSTFLADFWEEPAESAESAETAFDQPELSETAISVQSDEVGDAEPVTASDEAGAAEDAVDFEATLALQGAAELPAPESDTTEPAELAENTEVIEVVEVAEVAAIPAVPAPVAVAEPVEASIPEPVQVLQPVPTSVLSLKDPAQREPSQEQLLREEKTVQFVGFLVGTQMYAVPSIMIREVIRRQPLSRLPVDTRYVPGVINLRGLVIPLVSLRELLQAGPADDGSHDQFSIIAGSGGLCIGLAVDRIRSMYVIRQEDIVWNVSGLLGLDDETIIGLFELDEKLVPILSVERVAATLLEEGLDLERLA